MATRYIGANADRFTAGQGPLMFRNRIINGNFDIWQRGTSQTSSGYGSDDRWSNANVGSTKTASRQSFTLGQTDVPGEPTYFSRTVVSSVAGAGNLVIKGQAIESVRTFAGQTATLSFWAKADASKNMAIEFAQNFGTGGSPSAGVTGIGVTTCALTTSWKKFTVTVSIPSISGKTLGTNNDDFLTINFWFDAGSNFNARTNSLGQQSGTFDIAQVQLEAGSSATEFEYRPIGTELALCQRYYQIILSPTINQYQTVGSAYNTSWFFFKVFFKTNMRAMPTIENNSISISINTNATAVSGAVLQNTGTTYADPSSIGLRFDKVSSFTSGAAGHVDVVSGSLAVTAEL